jgi:CRISPR-associated protein (TIGR02710 family)
MVHSANPWDALGFQAVESFVGLFDQHAFAAATSVANQAMRNASEQARKRELNALRLMSEAYNAWDRFDHKGAASKLNDLEKYDNDLQAILGQTAADRIRRLTRQHKDYLRQLLDDPTPSVRHVTDLLANALRRKDEGRIDDAIARLYRAIEALAQVALAKRHNLPNTKQVPLSEVPEMLRGHWASRAEKGSVFLGLQDAYALLDARGDELGAKFKRLNLHDRERSPLTARNRSILAHGFERVSEQVFEQLWKAVLELSNVPETELPSFPRIGT